MPTPAETLRNTLQALNPASPRYASDLVDHLLTAARTVNASDVHIEPGPGEVTIRWRLDGVLQPASAFPAAFGANVVARLKVLADLLTYQTDLPQEGRLRLGEGASRIEMRLSTFPTIHGENAVVRLFASANEFLRLDDLAFPDDIRAELARALAMTSGMIVLSGPAGAGKTTALYACLRELVGLSEGKKSLATLEDPVEVALEGVAQSQANAAAGFTLERGLRSLLRQDPEVIALGEIRDRSTAEVAFQASLTGHLVLTTFHAGTAAGVISRLSDMGIPPYVLRGGLIAVVAQRLLRGLCVCSRPGVKDDPVARLEPDGPPGSVPVGCDRCAGTGYRGRFLIAELLRPEVPPVATALLARADRDTLDRAARSGGMIALWQRARDTVRKGRTSAAEVRRVLGLEDVPATALDLLRQL